MAVTRINVSLDEAHALGLANLPNNFTCKRTVARSLLSRALDDLAPEPHQISDLLDRIPSARERIAAGLAEFDAGRTIPLDQL